MKLTSQILSPTSLTPDVLTGEDGTQADLAVPMQMRPQWVTVMVRSWNG